jgi:nitroimidazol reductase NimA-like FMN-containing flavoprotein (pyridoxamine 5'-phosphate oxidase superfamily)
MEIADSETYGAWTGAEIEAFLADARIPLRLSMRGPNGALIVPVWFEYRNNSFWSCSPSDSLLVRTLRACSEIAFDVSTNDLPYRGVRGRGLARCTVSPDSSVLERLLDRYLGSTDNALSQWLLNRRGEESLIEVAMLWLTSWDFTDRMSGIETIARRDPGAIL